MTDTTVIDPTRMPKIPRTEAAEQLATSLAQVLTLIIERFHTLADPAAEAVIAGTDFTAAEQLCADEDHLHDVCSAVLKRYGITEYHATDHLNELLIALTGTSGVDDALEDHSPARKARYLAWCEEHGYDPDEEITVATITSESTEAAQHARLDTVVHDIAELTADIQALRDQVETLLRTT